MAFGADDDADARCALQSVAFDVPPCAGEDVMAGGGKRGRVGHLPAGDKRMRGVRGQPEQFLQPRAGDFFDDGCGRAGDVQAGVLIPRGREPVGRQRGGYAAADDEAEVASAGLGDDARVGGGGEMGDDGVRSSRFAREGPTQGCAEILERHAWEDRPRVQRLVKIRRNIGRMPEEPAQVVHRRPIGSPHVMRWPSASIGSRLNPRTSS